MRHPASRYLTRWIIAAFLGGFLLPLRAAGSEEQAPFCFSTETFSLQLNAAGQVTALTAADGAPLLKEPKAFASLRVTKEDKGNASSALTREGDTVIAEFTSPEGEKLPQRVRFRIESNDCFLSVEPVEVTGDWYALEFASVPLAINYDQTAGFGATTISAALGAIPLAMPGMSDRLGGKTYSATFPRGAKILLIAAEKARLRQAIQTAAESIEPGTMPISGSSAVLGERA